MSEYKLTTEIMSRSVGKTWDEAKLEWELDDIDIADEPSTCLCGHFPIIELCTIRNTKNGNHAVVGNCCIKRFIGLPSDKIFQALKRVRKDHSRALNAETIDYVYKKGWINDWEQRFYFDTMRKRTLSEKQSRKRSEINKRVVRNVIKDPP